MPNKVVAGKDSSDVRCERGTDGGEEWKKFMRDRPVVILKPLKQVVRDWLNRGIASFHGETSGIDVGLVLWDQWMS